MIRALLARLRPQRTARQEWEAAVASFNETRAEFEGDSPSDEAWAAYRAGLLAESDDELRRCARVLDRETRSMHAALSWP